MEFTETHRRALLTRKILNSPRDVSQVKYILRAFISSPGDKKSLARLQSAYYAAYCVSNSSARDFLRIYDRFSKGVHVYVCIFYITFFFIILHFYSRRLRAASRDVSRSVRRIFAQSVLIYATPRISINRTSRTSVAVNIIARQPLPLPFAAAAKQ